MARQWILRQHRLRQRVEPVETAAQIHWRRRHGSTRVALRPLIIAQEPGGKRPPLHFSSAPASHRAAPPPPPNSPPNPGQTRPLRQSAPPPLACLARKSTVARCPRANPVAPQTRRASDPTPETAPPIVGVPPPWYAAAVHSLQHHSSTNYPSQPCGPPDAPPRTLTKYQTSPGPDSKTPRDSCYQSGIEHCAFLYAVLWLQIR